MTMTETDWRFFSQITGSNTVWNTTNWKYFLFDGCLATYWKGLGSQFFAFSWWQVPTSDTHHYIRPSHWKQGTKDWITIKIWLLEQGRRHVNETASGKTSGKKDFYSFCCVCSRRQESQSLSCSAALFCRCCQINPRGHTILTKSVFDKSYPSFLNRHLRV